MVWRKEKNDRRISLVVREKESGRDSARDGEKERKEVKTRSGGREGEEEECGERRENEEVEEE